MCFVAEFKQDQTVICLASVTTAELFHLKKSYMRSMGFKVPPIFSAVDLKSTSGQTLKPHQRFTTVLIFFI